MKPASKLIIMKWPLCLLATGQTNSNSSTRTTAIHFCSNQVEQLFLDTLLLVNINKSKQFRNTVTRFTCTSIHYDCELLSRKLLIFLVCAGYMISSLSPPLRLLLLLLLHLLPPLLYLPLFRMNFLFLSV